MSQINAWAEYCKSLSTPITKVCEQASVASVPAALTKALHDQLPDWHFRHVLCRGGWYRLGGIVKSDGTRFISDLEQWAEKELETRDGDFIRLSDDFAQQDLWATRLVGRTHYLVAPAGEGTENFLQLEIEDLQEVKSHLLFDGEKIPTSLEELVAPDHAQTGQPVSLAHYVRRRISHVGTFLNRMLAQSAEPAPIHRMLADWKNSSAGIASEYYNHWIVLMREHQDRYQQSIFRAQTFPVLSGDPPEFNLAKDTRELALRDALVVFDRAVGYPMAWYFHMFTTKAVPHWVAQTVVEDALSGFAYLPEKDIEVVRNWLHRPYSA
jgi:hypothetical protein